MARPKLLLVPVYTEVEWTIRPLLEEWADVASYDPPGVGGTPRPERFGIEATLARGLEVLDELGWSSCVIVADEFAVADAILIARERRDRVAGLALGHAALHLRRHGENAALSAEVLSAFEQMTRTDIRSFVRALSQLTQGAYDDDFADSFLARVPRDLPAEILAAGEAFLEDLDIGSILRALDLPLLLAEHRDCLVWQPHTFPDATAAFPEATAISCDRKPTGSPEFAEALRVFCLERVPAGVDASPG